jgi:hypothetical protein
MIRAIRVIRGQFLGIAQFESVIAGEFGRLLPYRGRRRGSALIGSAEIFTFLP